MRRLRVSSAAALVLLVGTTAAIAQSGSQTQGNSDPGRLSAAPAGGSADHNGPAADREGTKATERLVLSNEQQDKISKVLRQTDIKPIDNTDFDLAAGATVPNSVPLVPVPDTILAVLPQFRNYSFFVDKQHELVFVDPALKKIKARVPISLEPRQRTTSRTEPTTSGGGTHDNSRDNATGTGKRARAKPRPDTQLSDQSDAQDEQSHPARSAGSRAVAHSKERTTSDAAASAQGSEDAPSTGITPHGVQRNPVQGRAQNGFYRGKAVPAETDVTVGSAWPETIEGPPPVIRRVGPPVRTIRPVEPGPSPEPTRPTDSGPPGLFGLFGLFR